MNNCKTMLIKTKHLLQELGISRSTLYRWIKKYNFPAPHNTGFYSVSEVNNWILKRKESLFELDKEQ
ncbi:helix-turn-helix transcriptional regulator [Aeromonas veronii]|uniref:helix-turn-helix transcriptional regulator n=1 Tax=Aeromonas veronii TaxID=654 RepID=UPI003D15E21F